ncbi:MAG: RICIN domain-containing protein, partial [Rhodospirillales bacterium]
TCAKQNPDQQFKLEPQRGDYFLIRSVSSGKCLGVASEEKKNGIPVQQWSCLGYDNQLWKKIDRAGGWFALRAKHSGKCLDGGERPDGVLYQNECAEARAGFQFFRMVR